MKSYRYYRGCCNKENDNSEADNQIVDNESSNDESIDLRQSCNMMNNSNNYNNSNSCACGFDMDSVSQFPSNPMYGQSYVPIQTMNKVFNPETGLKMGTIYPELVSPYSPCQSIRTIEFLKNSNDFREGIN
jgi:hypothetical protein